jgi:hypothetical protein
MYICVYRDSIQFICVIYLATRKLCLSSLFLYTYIIGYHQKCLALHASIFHIIHVHNLDVNFIYYNFSTTILLY